MRYNKWIQSWLLIGIVMVFVQVVVGGVTRLTGSGLSITKWEIVTGVVPPLSANDWAEEFDLYKSTPQYQKLNQGMSLSEFKFIYFWEYLHRLWARAMGFVFFIPLMGFLWKRWIDKALGLRLLLLVFMGGVVATFGWIMVASGLVERPWVDAYKLTIHLNLALVLYGILVYTYLYTRGDDASVYTVSARMGSLLNVFTVLLAVQLVLGGIMSGMKAGLYYPTWPDMNGEIIPRVLLDGQEWRLESFTGYDKYPLAPALVQFWHRIVAYGLAIFAALIFWRRFDAGLTRNVKAGIYTLAVLVVIQVMIGILTVINCVGKIPLFLGVAHQAMAVLLLTTALYLRYYVKNRNT